MGSAWNLGGPVFISWCHWPKPEPFPFQMGEKCTFFFCPAEQTAPFEQTQVRGTVLAAFSNPLEGLTRYRVMKEMKPSKWWWGVHSTQSIPWCLTPVYPSSLLTRSLRRRQMHLFTGWGMCFIVFFKHTRVAIAWICSTLAQRAVLVMWGFRERSWLFSPPADQS